MMETNGFSAVSIESLCPRRVVNGYAADRSPASFEAVRRVGPGCSARVSLRPRRVTARDDDVRSNGAAFTIDLILLHSDMRDGD